jgi:iron complex outermembrane recepter protein
MKSLVLFLFCGLPLVALPAELSRVVEFNIPAQPLSTALIRFSQQTNLQVVTSGAKIDGMDSRGVTGRYPVGEALGRVLQGTGLSYRGVGEGTITIVAAEPAAESSQMQVEEIVVTAQKRLERAQDVPVPVTAISAGKLVDSNQMRIQDYYTRIPGLSVTLSNGSGDAPNLTIRGVNTGGNTNPTVGIVVDDVPYGGSTINGGGLVAPDIDPSELQRVEVLRGPQGTLYGASSIGGLLKLVTIDPSTEAFSGNVRAGVSAVRNGDGPSHTVSGAVNVPLGENFAVRASGFSRRDAGYIDDPARQVEGVNRTAADGGRLSALWRPSDDVSLKLSALVQDMERRGSDEAFVQSGLGDLQQTALRDTGQYGRKSEVYSATLNARLGNVDLISATGYSLDEQYNNVDIPSLADFTEAQFGVRGTSLPVLTETSKFTQEIRLSGPLSARVDWLFGAFYTHEDAPTQGSLLAIDPVTGATAGYWLRTDIEYTFAEYAAFADLTFHVTERFDVQIGGRESRNRQTYSSFATGPLIGGDTVTPEVIARDDAFTYLVTPRFKISEDLMVYGRLASGYRAGGPNQQCLPLRALGIDACDYQADTTENYEIGIKGNVPDHAFSFDASLYYIDWKDVQLFLTQGSFSYVENAGRARSRGVELSVESRPLTGLTLAAWVAWNDAELADALPVEAQVFGASGAQLPYSSPLSANVSLEQEFPLSTLATGFAGASVSYVDERLGTFKPAGVARPMYPSYVQIDLRAGVRYDSWSFNAFANNVTDRRGVLDGDLTLSPGINYIQPRTIGVSLAKAF